MEAKKKTIRLVLVLCALNLVLMSSNQPLVEGVLFFDLRCAPRIDALERKISDLIVTVQNQNQNQNRQQAQQQQQQPIGNLMPN